MPFWQPFATASKRFIENMNMSVVLYNNINPRNSALGKPLRMAAHMLKRGDPPNLRRTKGQTAHHGDDVCGGTSWISCRVVPVLFLPFKTYCVGDPNRGIPVNPKNQWHKSTFLPDRGVRL